MNFGSVRSDRVKLFFFLGGLIFETNCIFEYKPSPHFRLDVSYSMGTSPHQGLINRVLASPKASSYIIGLVATE